MIEIETNMESIEGYLFNNLKGGFWRDFKPSHGESTYWVTSYVGRNLATSGKNIERLEPIKERLTSSQKADGGWSYNDSVPSDADTTANCLLFLSKFKGNPETRAKAIKFLLNHQNETGGFSTYTEEEFERIYGNKYSGKGWCLSNVEVTALVIKALSQFGHDLEKNIEQALDFLASKQNIDGSWNSYWWSSDDYATSQSLEVLTPDHFENINKATEWIKGKRATYGWLNKFTRSYSPFYTALNLKALLTSGIELEKRDITKLLEHQNEDGSFNSEPILRIPRPDVINIAEIQDWATDVGGRNSVFRDQNRCFTTATVYSTLSKI